MMTNNFLDLKTMAIKDTGQCKFRVILRGEFEYDSAREISNSLFDRKPQAVAFPRNAQHVQMCLQYCIDRNLPFRTRSGGHQHEGMSSLDDGLVIRMSDMSLITYDEDRTTAWIDSGMELGAVYSELERYGMILPGGGCSTVNVGGLTQGGGWGMHARQWGLTCDSVRAVEIVLYSQQEMESKVEIVSAENKPKLFRALRGGGGGNFGIVTRFKFQLRKKPLHLTSFRFGWKASKMKKVANNWLSHQAVFPESLTSFVRFSVMQKDGPPPRDNEKEPLARDYPIYAGGLFYGEKKDLIKLKGMISLMTNPKPDQEEWPSEEEILDKSLRVVDLFGYDDFSEGLIHSTESEGTSELKGTIDSKCNVAPPSSNCNMPHPHKVSSAFSNGKDEKYYERVATAITKYILASQYDPYVRSYMTFHAMGGAIAKEPEGGRTFAYKDNEFLLQFQSWWNHLDTKECKEFNKDKA